MIVTKKWHIVVAQHLFRKSAQELLSQTSTALCNSISAAKAIERIRSFPRTEHIANVRTTDGEIVNNLGKGAEVLREYPGFTRKSLRLGE